METCIRDEIFWSYVDRDQKNDCWLWTAYRVPRGYGKFRVGSNKEYAHRVSRVIAHGPIPLKLQVLHSCDNPPCVNPEHLFLGTNKINRADSVNKSRHARGVGHGRHKINEDDVRNIRVLHTQGFHVSIAMRLYDLSKTQIERIINKRLWKHLD